MFCMWEPLIIIHPFGKRRRKDGALRFLEKRRYPRSENTDLGHPAPILIRRKAAYCKAAIRLSSAALGGRVSDSGSVASGSSTTLSRSMKVGLVVSM